jgi:hypothetical protein
VVLSHDEIGFYRANGWLRIDQLITAQEASRLHDDLVELRARLFPGTTEFTADRQNYIQTGEFQRRHRLYPDAQCINERFRALLLSPKLGAIARGLLGVDAVRLITGSVLEKLPESQGGGVTPFHQDYPLMPLDRTGAATIWIALMDIPAGMGSLNFVSGSHRFGSLGRDPTVRPDRNLVERVAAREHWEATSSGDMRAGDATVHHDLMVHCAGANHSSESRWAVNAVYIDADALYTGAPCRVTDDLGLVVNQPLDHERFPLVG